MAYDPLSQATRKTKSSLVLTSATLFLVVHFEVTLTNLPGLGLQLDAPDAFLNYALFAATFYLLVVYLVYATQDFVFSDGPESYRKNLERLEELLEDELIKNTHIEDIDDDDEKVRETVRRQVRLTMNVASPEYGKAVSHFRAKENTYKIARNVRFVTDYIAPIVIGLGSLVYTFM